MARFRVDNPLLPGIHKSLTYEGENSIMATKTYEVKFNLFNSKGEKVNGLFTENVPASGTHSDEKRAAQHISWAARHLGLTAEIVSSKASTTEPTRLKPLRLVVETADERKKRMNRERRQAKKLAAAA